LNLGVSIGVSIQQLLFHGTESVTEDIPNIPGIDSGGMVVGNFGFGISF